MTWLKNIITPPHSTSSVSNNYTKERIGWIDALKFFAIFLVLWGHSIQHLQTTIYYDQPIYRIIYSFHMPLFMALSGFFAVRLSERSVIKVFRDKLRQLILPIISLSIIFFILRQICKLTGKYENVWFVNIYPENGFWFLKSAFICSITYFIISKSKKFYIPLLILTLILSQYFNGYLRYQLDVMYPSFILGVYINKKLNWIVSNSKLIISISGIIFLVMLFFWDASFWKFPYFHDIETGKLSFENTSLILFRRLYRIIIGLAGTLFFISLFEFFSHYFVSSKISDKIIKFGRLTLGIYIFQIFLLEELLRNYLNFDGTNFITFNFVIAPLISIAVLLVCVFIIQTIRKYKILNLFLLGSIDKKIGI